MLLELKAPHPFKQGLGCRLCCVHWLTDTLRMDAFFRTSHPHFSCTLEDYLCIILCMKAIPCPVSPEALRAMVEDEQLTDLQIAEHLGTTKKRVQNWRNRFEITAIPKWERNQVLPIEGRLQSLLVGSMLGDGRLVRQVNATYYTEGHCEEQVPYLQWKTEQWGDWVKFDPPVYAVPSKEGYPQFCMRTCAHGSLNSWQELFYADHHKGWKRLLPEVVDLVDDFALAIWYLDDGTAGWWPGIIFGADKASHQVAQAIFEKFGLKPRWQTRQGKTGTFHMEREDTAERFLEIVTPHIPACMAYKLTFGFQGPHYQVRKRLTEVDLLDGVAKGVPIDRMARELGVGSSTLRRKLQKMGIAYNPPKGRPQTSAPWLTGPQPLVTARPLLLGHEGDKMHTLIKSGLTGQEVAEVYGVHKATIYRRIREAGHPPLKTGPKSKDFLPDGGVQLEVKYPDTSLWRAQDSPTQEAWILDVQAILGKVKFPYPEQVSSLVRDKKMRSLRAKEAVLDHSPLGLSLCYSFFPNRYQAKYKGNASALQAWHDPKAMKRAIKWQFKVGDPVTPPRVLKAVCANARTPTIFRPAVAAALYKRYCKPGDSVWDPCAGFGGRLVGAVAAGVRYVATDVAEATVDGNLRLAEWLGASDETEIHLCPAEEFSPPPVQMVFTSPPYFQQEQYVGGDQSWSEYGTFESWRDGFLKPMIHRGAEALVSGGHWVMNIADVKDKDVVHPLVETAREEFRLAGLVEVETLMMPLSNLNRRSGGEPILVWQRR